MAHATHAETPLVELVETRSRGGFDTRARSSRATQPTELVPQVEPVETPTGNSQLLERLDDTVHRDVLCCPIERRLVLAFLGRLGVANLA